VTPITVVSKRKGYVAQPGDVYIGRPTMWGNPFTIGRDGTRDEVIAKYRTWLGNNLHVLGPLIELQPKRLVCWCAPLACHGDVLAEVMNKMMDIMVRDGWHDYRTTG
jgi:hypothetical protein